MMNETPDPVFTDLQPAAVWAHFAMLCRMPRRSKAEGPLRDAIRQRALARGLTASVDAAGNLLIRKAASTGREKAPGVVLQAHLDMVCQKSAESGHDFSRDPIRPVRRDGWLLVEDTTLGAENGIGVALILAAMEDTSIISEIYYKKLTDLVSYELDNVRIRYAGENNSTGYNWLGFSY